MKKIVSILLVVTCLFTAMIFPNTASAENEYKILFKNEPIVSELKAIIKNAHRGELLEWNTLLEQRTMIKSLK